MHNLQCVAYTQWCNSFITGNVSSPASQTVANITLSDTVTGYPELSYFKVAKFNIAILENTDLFNYFFDVKLWNNFTAGHND